MLKLTTDPNEVQILRETLVMMRQARRLKDEGLPTTAIERCLGLHRQTVAKAFALAYGLRPRACWVEDPETKGKVESTVG